MKKSKRLLTLLLAAVVLAATPGCSKKQQETANTKTVYKDNDDFYTIEWYYINPDIKQKDVAPVQKKLNEYLKEKINAEVHMNVFDWGTYSERTKLMLQSGEKMDLMYTKSGDYYSYAAKKAFIPVNDLMEQYAPKLLKTLDKNLLEGSKYGGVNYGVPANKETAAALGCIYRKDIAEKLGIDMESMKSPQDVVAVLDKVKAAYPDVIPYLLGASSPITGWLDFESLYLGFGQFESSDSDKLVSIYETDKYKEACDLAYELRQKGLAKNESGKTDDDILRAGRAFCFIGRLKPGKADEYNAKFGNKDAELAQVFFDEPTTKTADCVGSIMAIPRTSKNPARVMKFLELLNTDEYVNNLVNFGIEGDGYTKNSDGTVHINPNAAYRNTGTQWMMGNVFINYISDAENPDKNKKFLEFNKIARPSRFLGFSFDVEAVKNKAIAVSSVITEYEDQYKFGNVPISKSYDEFMSKMKKAGADDVLAELQKQYDEWKKIK